MISLKNLWPALVLIAAAPMPASAALVSFTGEDIMATTSSPHPNADAAAAQFSTAAGPTGLITFESAPPGSFTNLTVAPGVTMSGSDINGHDQTIRNTSNFPPFPTLDGYNTTSSGANFVEEQGGTVTFTFATPIFAFGAFLTGIQNFTQDTVTFSDGTSQTINVPEDGTSNSVGALDFVGFVDSGKSISSVTIFSGNNGFDDIGVDDVRFASAAVPEPASWALMILGFIGLGAAVRARRAATVVG